MRKLRPRGKLTLNLLADVLTLIGESLPGDAHEWTMRQRLQVYNWALRQHFKAADNLIAVPARPKVMQ